MLVSVANLTIDEINSFPTSATDVQQAAERAIEDVEQTIAGELDRDLELTRHFERPEWCKVGNKFQWIARDFPVIFVVQDVEIRGRTLISTTAHEEIEYIAGFARDDDDLVTIQDRGFPELTEVPDTVKPNIRRCIIALSEYELNRARGGSWGRQSHTVITGNQTATITKEAGDVYGLELKKINTEKVL